MPETPPPAVSGVTTELVDWWVWSVAPMATTPAVAELTSERLALAAASIVSVGVPFVVSSVVLVVVR